MTNPMTRSILSAGALALAVAITRFGPAWRAAAATPVPSRDGASTALPTTDAGEALASAPRSSLAGLATAPQDDGSDSGDEGDDGGDDEDG